MRLRAIAFALAALVTAPPLIACICITQPPKTSFRRADAVFVARVASYDGWLARLEVIRTLKGSPPPITVVATSRYDSDCGYGKSLVEGSSHLIFARLQQDGTLETSSCSRSKPLEKASCDLDILESHARRWWWRTPVSGFTPLLWLQKIGAHIPSACS